MYEQRLFHVGVEEPLAERLTIAFVHMLRFAQSIPKSQLKRLIILIPKKSDQPIMSALRTLSHEFRELAEAVSTGSARVGGVPVSIDTPKTLTMRPLFDEPIIAVGTEPSPVMSNSSGVGPTITYVPLNDDQLIDWLTNNNRSEQVE